jgi:hypothetical protein
MMRNMLLASTAILVLSACTNTSDVYPSGNGTFMVTATADGYYTDLSDAMKAGMNKAKQHCGGRSPTIVSVSESRSNWGGASGGLALAGQYQTPMITFRCE